MTNHPPIFIVGIARSGTTWLWGLLTSLPNVESYHVEGQSESAVFLKYEPSCAKKLIDKELARLNADKWLIEKTPDHLVRLKHIKRFYPESHVVIILRDPLDVVASMANSTGVGNYGQGFDWAYKKYVSWVGALQSNYKLIDHFVSYEQLMADPVSELSSLLDEIGVDYTAEGLDAATQENEGVSKINGNFRKGKVGGYADELTEEQQQAVLALPWLTVRSS